MASIIHGGKPTCNGIFNSENCRSNFCLAVPKTL